MTLRELLVITDITQLFEIWYDGCKVVQPTTDLKRYFESKGAPNDSVEFNLSSEVKKVWGRNAFEYKKAVYQGVLVIEMKEWRTE